MLWPWIYVSKESNVQATGPSLVDKCLLYLCAKHGNELLTLDFLALGG